MEDLTNSRLVLLVILVSFVVSITAGVMTVALLEQGPQPVTRTINQVVREVRPAPKEKDKEPVPEPEVVERVVVAERDEVITELREEFADHLVKVYNRTITPDEDQPEDVESGQGETADFWSRGIYDPQQEKVLTVIPEDPQQLMIRPASAADDQAGDHTVSATSSGSGLAILEFAEGSKPSFDSLDVLSFGYPKAGDTAVHLGGREDDYLISTRITRVSEKNGRKTVEVDVYPPDPQPGSLLVGLNGEILGIMEPKGEYYLYIDRPGDGWEEALEESRQDDSQQDPSNDEHREQEDSENKEKESEEDKEEEEGNDQ